jgi:putative endonuclease
MRALGKRVWQKCHRGFESPLLRSVRNSDLIGISTLLGRLNFVRNLLRPAYMFYYVYILQSLKNHSLYIGYTSDLKKRFKEHNSGLSQATKPFIPYKLICYEAFLNRIDAKNRETYLKSGYGRKTIKIILNKYLE